MQSKQLLDNAREGVAFAQDNMRSYKEYQQRGLITKDQLSGQTYSFYQQQSLFQNLHSQHIQESLQITNLKATSLRARQISIIKFHSTSFSVMICNGS